MGIPRSDFMIVVGGVFAINGGALGSARGNVHYFAPDTLAWGDTGRGYGAFVHWAFSGDLDTFYENVRWSGWQAEVEQIDGDKALSLYPPPWTSEGKNASNVSRRSISAAELWRLAWTSARS